MNVPLSLYLHLPWCVQKCPYCDFNSHTAGRHAPRARYVAALCGDIAREGGRAGGRPLLSVFLGGGTPSLFSGEEIGRILEAVRQACVLADDAEITMEANPGTLERHRLSGYRAAGVNRLSLGAQSFDDATLRRLGRIHTAADVSAAFRDARRAGFDNINLDLMYALPAQTPAMAAADLEHALALEPEHISYYQLTLEPNTVFFAQPPADLPDDDAGDAMQAHAGELLARAGFRQYEISAHARAGRACRHNLNYWTFGDYLAAGAGAHGKLSDAAGTVWRYRKPDHPRAYMLMMEHAAAAPAAPRQDAAGGGDMPRPLAPADVAFEYLLNALRLPAGFSAAHFSERTGLPVAAVEEQLGLAVADGLLEQPAAGCWRPSALGLRFLNDLQARFLPAGCAA
ncbi:MAG TPA: radical SAM family heme chaperone HemW [Woeseiaceae bacterium]|nr:radical SAM family heme chaperone HemW [Woeseiaceae bacterium]